MYICMVFDCQLCVVRRKLASEMSGGGESIVHAQQGRRLLDGQRTAQDVLFPLSLRLP